VNSISELNKFEEFYKDIFFVYGLTYDTETIRQKRTFVAAITKYFILDMLPEGCLFLYEDKYESNNKDIKELLKNSVDDFYKLFNTCNSNDEFKKKFAERRNEKVKDFSKEIAENRDDSLSDFAKVIQKVSDYKDEKGNC